jgi:1,4-alpha-glucan branching enzyme
MHGYASLLLHAHLPFVRHPEHERFLEESWLYEGILETYLPLLEMLEGWRQDRLPAKLTLSLSPTLCSMLRDPLLKERFSRRLDDLIRLTESETHRTALDPKLKLLAGYYHERFRTLQRLWTRISCDLVQAFATVQAIGQIEIITSAATHALLPLLGHHEPSIRAQILTARDDYRECFGCDPRGIWLPECAYLESVEPVLKTVGLRWFALESHGVLHASPQPRFGVYAPILTPHGLAAFGRDLESARQVWSRTEGYPGDPRYRDFYRDIGYELDFDYVQPHLPSPHHRGFTGIKYHRITGPNAHKEIYERGPALEAVAAHAHHFLDARIRQVRRLAGILGRPPLLLMPYDAELFGHWWHEGVEFLDQFIREACRRTDDLRLTTPGDYLLAHPTHQLAAPASSSWGEHGYYQVWLNESNDWILLHIDHAQHRMTNLARRFTRPGPLQKRALNQAARELLLAQASDWPFILRTGTSPEYAGQRVTQHLLRFNRLHHQLVSGTVEASLVGQWENQDNLFANIDYRYFR